MDFWIGSDHTLATSSKLKGGIKPNVILCLQYFIFIVCYIYCLFYMSLVLAR